mmetsp:Transcript_30779/g.70585  ORF Transcript_30779/g.70585 Transcript_30779/m.70585 type:complete len:226 (-) Transcript_30779:23-700(-)
MAVAIYVMCALLIPHVATLTHEGVGYEVEWSGSIREHGAPLLRADKILAAPAALDEAIQPPPGVVLPTNWPECKASTAKECDKIERCWWVVMTHSCAPKCPGAPKWYCSISDACRWSDALECVEAEPVCSMLGTNATQCNLVESCMRSKTRGCIERAHARCYDYSPEDCQIASPKDCMVSASSSLCMPARESQCKDYGEVDCANVPADRCRWHTGLAKCVLKGWT